MSESKETKATIHWMNPAAWDAMTPSEKVAHFKNHDVVVHHYPGDRIKLFQGVCGGIIVSTWHRTEQQALEAYARSIAANIEYLTLTQPETHV